MITDKTIFAGDWHKDGHYIKSLLSKLASLDTDTIIHVGDVGFMFGPDKFASDLSKELEKYNINLFFIEGNHEDYGWLSNLERTEDGLGIVRHNITHIPRGYRTKYSGETFLFMGGGVSVDQYRRTPGIDWWEEEEITHSQVSQTISDGPADILVSHDCPANFQLNLPFTNSFPEDLIKKSNGHREILGGMFDKLEIRKVICGHYHIHEKQDGLILLNCNDLEVKGTQFATVDELLNLKST